MGQKVHPYGFRLGYNKDWHSHWFAKRQFGDFLIEDLKLKRELKQRFTGAGVSHVDIERAANRLKIIIYTSRPGIIIGRKGAEIDKLKGDISSRTGREVLVSIQEIHKPELNAQLQAEKIAAQLEKRIAFRRAMRKAVEESLRFGAQGIKVKVSGRLNSAEIARSEWHLQGQLPLHTLRSDVDYGLKTLEAAWITDRQIEAARIAMTRHIKRGGKIWIRMFPDKPVTKKPAETRMGKGKGAPEYWVAVVKPGRVLYEIEGVDEKTAREAMKLASQKLPVKTKFVTRAEQEGGAI